MLSANINSQLSLIGQNQARKKKLDDIVARKAAEDGSFHLCHRIIFRFFVFFFLGPRALKMLNRKAVLTNLADPKTNTTFLHLRILEGDFMKQLDNNVKFAEFAFCY